VLEEETRFQSENGKWLEERRKLLTASIFCKNLQTSKLVRLGPRLRLGRSTSVLVIKCTTLLTCIQSSYFSLVNSIRGHTLYFFYTEPKHCRNTSNFENIFSFLMRKHLHKCKCLFNININIVLT
jgi:hypothetical protein